MSSKFEHDNYHVEVYPKHPGDFGGIFMSGITRTSEEEKRECERIADEINRHVNGAQKARLVFDASRVCEFCGSKWTEDSKTYNGGCCDLDESAELLREQKIQGGVA